jgi:hypothetical protein
MPQAVLDDAQRGIQISVSNKQVSQPIVRKVEVWHLVAEFTGQAHGLFTLTAIPSLDHGSSLW